MYGVSARALSKQMPNQRRDFFWTSLPKLGFKTVVELAGPDNSQGNGRVEREIQTVRGLARTLIRAVREGAQAEVDVYGPLAQ